MQDDTSLDFSQKLRRAMELLGRLVWESHGLGLRCDGEWPEAEFFAALVNQGFRCLDPRAKDVFGEMEAARPYRMRFDCARHNQQKLEPITGADLGIAVTVTVNGTQVSQRGFLVQLKKAVFDEKAKAIQFEDMHLESGEKIFGRKLHQAERMSLFTDAAVYWLAVPPGSDSDKTFFQKYIEANNLARRRERRRQRVAGAQPIDSANVAHFAGGALAPWIEHPEYIEYLDYILHRLERRTGTKMSAKSLRDRYRKREGENLLRGLRLDTAVEVQHLYGRRSLTPVLVAHAESILALRQRGQRSLSDLFDGSVCLAEFILGDVIADDFGDDNTELVDAILRNQPNDYIRRIVRSFKAEVPDKTPVVRDVLQISLSVEVTDQSDQRP